MAAKRKAPRIVSEWNGKRSSANAVVAEAFDAMNALARAIRAGSVMLPTDVADVLDAVAWGINRDDLSTIAKLAPSARTWIDRHRPLVSDRELRRLDKERLAAAGSENDAYRYACTQADDALTRQPNPIPMALANHVAHVIIRPLPRLGKRHVDALAVRIEGWIDNGRSLDGRAVVNAALRIAGLSAGRMRSLDTWLQQQERRADRKPA